MERYQPKNTDSFKFLLEANPKVDKAYWQAHRAHEGQKRAEGTPYFSHCVDVAKILYEEWGIKNPDIIIAALLHDTVEDTKVTLKYIREEFGDKIAFWVEGVSQLRSEKDNHGLSKEEKDRETVKKVISKNLIDPVVGVLKLADRLHNMRTLQFMPEVKRIAKAKETEGYAKLAESLGMWNVMRELEDLSMKHANPENYEKYSKIIKEDRRTQPEFVEWMKSTLGMITQSAGVEADIKTREISLPKLQNKKGKYLTEKVNDLISFGIIVKGADEAETRKRVYEMLGVIREYFSDIEDMDRFDDFYSKPRDNGYSAIQITLEFPQGSVEVAITSDKRDDFNNWGVVNLIRDGNQELSKHALKLVFTKTHEVKFFDPEASGLDFAYAISPNMGARATKIWVDDEIKPISTILPNGSEVEVEMGEARIAPPAEYRNFCLPETRRMIDEQLSEQTKREYEKTGKRVVYEIISKRGLIDLSDLKNIYKYSPVLDSLLFTLGCKGSIYDLYYKIGAGVMEVGNLEKTFDDFGITKKALGLTSILIEGIDGPGISSLVMSQVAEAGGNIGPMENRPCHNENTPNTFTLRMVVENLSGDSEKELSKKLTSDKRITKVVIV